MVFSISISAYQIILHMVVLEKCLPFCVFTNCLAQRSVMATVSVSMAPAIAMTTGLVTPVIVCCVARKTVQCMDPVHQVRADVHLPSDGNRVCNMSSPNYDQKVKKECDLYSPEDGDKPMYVCTFLTPRCFNGDCLLFHSN